MIKVFQYKECCTKQSVQIVKIQNTVPIFLLRIFETHTLDKTSMYIVRASEYALQPIFHNFRYLLTIILFHIQFRFNMDRVNYLSEIFFIFIITAVVSFWFYRWWMQGSRYTKNTRIEGKVVLITGANTGIGKETAVELARRGGKVYIACRSAEKGEKALRDIKERSNSTNVYFLQMDLASMNSIRNCVQEFVRLEDKLNILINNAGVFACPQSQTEDEFETQFGVNHLGHFLLTNLLLNMLIKSAPARIINVTSLLHLQGNINKHDLMHRDNYDPFVVYNQSKLANVIFTKELARRYKAQQIASFSLHPGLINTEAFRHLNDRLRIFKPFSKIISYFFFKTPDAGAQTTLHCALEPNLEEKSGEYFNNCKISKPNRLAHDRDLANWLWDESAKLVKLQSIPV